MSDVRTSLPPGTLWSTRLDGRAIDVTCDRGSLWLTRDGEDDVVLEPGQRWHGEGRGHVVVEALERSRVLVESPETERGMKPSTVAVAIALIAVYVIWGSTYYAMRVALESLPPFLMAGPRFLIAGALMYAFLRLRGAPPPTREQWIASGKVGLLLLTGGNGAVAIGQRSVSSSVAAVVVATMPIWAAVFARATGMRTTGREWIGLALGFCGVVLLNLGGALHVDGPGLVLLLAPVFWAIGSVWSRKLPLPEGPMAAATQMIVAGGSMLLLAGLTGERVHAPLTLRTFGALAYLTLFGSIVGFTAYAFLLRRVRPALATSYAYVNPIVALGIGAWLGGESVSALTIAAAAVSLLGVALISAAR